MAASLVAAIVVLATPAPALARSARAALQPLSLSSSPSGIGASFTCNGGPCASKYAIGTSLTVVASAAWYTLTGYSGDCGGATCSFTMPASGASVTASFSQKDWRPFSRRIKTPFEACRVSGRWVPSS